MTDKPATSPPSPAVDIEASSEAIERLRLTAYAAGAMDGEASAESAADWTREWQDKYNAAHERMESAKAALAAEIRELRERVRGLDGDRHDAQLRATRLAEALKEACGWLRAINPKPSAEDLKTLGDLEFVLNGAHSHERTGRDRVMGTCERHGPFEHAYCFACDNEESERRWNADARTIALRASLASAEKRFNEAVAQYVEIDRQVREASGIPIVSPSPLPVAIASKLAAAERRVGEVERGLERAITVIDTMNANAQGQDHAEVRDPVTYAIATSAIVDFRALLGCNPAAPKCGTCGGSGLVHEKSIWSRWRISGI